MLNVADRLHLPSNMQLTGQGAEFEVAWRWPDRYLFEFFFAVVVACLLAWPLGLHAIRGNSAMDGLVRLFSPAHNPFALLVPIYILAVLGLLYCFAAHAFNSTHVCVSPSAVVIRQGPVPWRGDRRFEFSTFKQIFIKPNHVGSRMPGSSTLFLHYDLLAMGRNDEAITLLGGRSLQREQAIYLQKLLARYFVMPDQPQPGAGATP